MAKKQNVRVSNSAVGKIAFKKILSWVGIGLAVILVIYLLFAAMLMRVVPGFSSGVGLVPVKNNTFMGGDIPSGTDVLVDSSPQFIYGDSSIGYDPITNLKYSVDVTNSNLALIEILAGPTGKLSWSGGIVTVDGNPVPGVMPEVDGESPLADREEMFLMDEYIGECVAGACPHGELVIFPKKAVAGIVIGDVLEKFRELDLAPQSNTYDDPQSTSIIEDDDELTTIEEDGE